jgi:hypothetical protein
MSSLISQRKYRYVFVNNRLLVTRSLGYYASVHIGNRTRSFELNGSRFLSLNRERYVYFPAYAADLVWQKIIELYDKKKLEPYEQDLRGNRRYENFLYFDNDVLFQLVEAKR